MAGDWKGFSDADRLDFRQEEVHQIPVKNIRPNPYQPRLHLEDEKIAELAQSINTYGLLQPVMVRKTEDGTELVAGQRRLMAVLRLGWTHIPALVRKMSDSAVATIALIENLQRENLTFWEEAQGYERLIKEFSLTQEVLAQRMGKSQSTIANKLRLLKLSGRVQEILMRQDLTERHARSLLKLTSEEQQLKVLREIANLGYTVKQTEKRVAEILGSEAEPAAKERKKVIIRDIRIFLNTLRQAVSVLEAGGLGPKMKEEDYGDYLEITIRLPKNRAVGEKITRNKKFISV